MQTDEARAASEQPVGPQVIFGMDAHGRCTMSVGPGLAMLGVKPGELVGQDLFEVYGTDPATAADLRRALSGETFTVESDFEGRVLSVLYQAMVDENGIVTGAVGVSTDVTEQRRLEREVHDAQRRAGLLADLAIALSHSFPDTEAMARVTARLAAQGLGDLGAVWVHSHEPERLTPTGWWLADPGAEALPSVRRMCGDLDPRSANRLRGPRIVDVAGVAGEAPLRAAQLPLRARGTLLGLLCVARAADAGPFDPADLALLEGMADRCAVVLDSALLLHDHHRARQELMKFEALAEASNDLVAISGPDGRVLYTNPRVREAGIQVAADEVWATVAKYAGEDATRRIQDAIGEAGHWRGVLRLAIADAVVLVDADIFDLSHPTTGASLGTAWIARDITEMREFQDALAESNEELRQFKALVDASHDFIAIADLDGRGRYINPGGRALVDLGPDEDVRDMNVSDVLAPASLVLAREVVVPTTLAEGYWEGDLELVGRSGRVVPVVGASFVVRDPATGEPHALATVLRDVTERRRAETALRTLADQRQALLTRLVDAEDAERTRIAADVHDDPVQVLGAVDLRLGLLHRRLAERAPDLLELLEPLQASVSGATERLRALLFDLEPPDLERGLEVALDRAAREIFGSEVRWSLVGGEEAELPAPVRARAYRIAKEAMRNARQHAQAGSVEITVAGRDGGVEVSVADDGVGLRSGPAPGHRGIANMKDLAAVAGGHCRIEPRPGGGTSVTIWLPGRLPR